MLLRNWTGNLLVFNIVEVSFIFRSAPGSVGFSEIGASMPTAWKSFSEGLARVWFQVILHFAFYHLRLTAGLPWYTPLKIDFSDAFNRFVEPASGSS